jgi:pyruvate dehydrogenase (quinone)
VLDRAIRIALARRAPTCVVLPKDVQELAATSPKRAHDHVRSGLGSSAPRVVPQERELDRAADVLNAGERVAILVGAGALDAREEVAEIADRLGAGVAKALLGKAVLPDDLPWVTGSIGLLGTRPSWDLMQRCDTFLMLGSGFPYAEFLPEEGRARGVQVDLEAGMLSVRYPMEVNLVGDCALTIRALLRRLRPKTDGSWRADVESRVARWWKRLEARAYARSRGLNPERVLWELSPRLPDRAMVVSDVGTSTIWFARCVRLRAGMDATTSGGLASMGNGIPYALAWKLANPERPVVAVCGDGAMQMLGNSELVTVAKYASRWGRSPFVVLVLNNRDLAMVSWEQRVLVGTPKVAVSQNLPDFAFATYAETIGLHGVRLEHAEDVGAAWEEAFSAGRPTVIEAMVDADVPPLPPHVSFAQASHAAAALLRGDEDAGAILVDSWHQVMDPLLHR